MKNPLTLAGIEPETFRFLTQHLNHCATAVPLWRNLKVKISYYITSPFTSRPSGGISASEFVTCPRALLEFITQILRASRYIHSLTFPPSQVPIFSQTPVVFPPSDMPISAGTLHKPSWRCRRHTPLQNSPRFPTSGQVPCHYSSKQNVTSSFCLAFNLLVPELFFF